MVLALLVLGPKRLPEVGRSLGKTLAEFKRATNGIKDSIQRELENAAREASADPPKSTLGTNPDASKS